MNIEELREYCISKPHVEETFPFNETTLVFKVGGKMFLLVDIHERPVSFNIKCEPEKAVELREKYSFVQPGFHMSKTHWNTVTCESGANKKLLKEWIDDSYNLVIAGLPKKDRAKLGL
ncbi:MAG: MmcQ/YjbR family DNA-binding protein [Bacteroidia bacterium]